MKKIVGIINHLIGSIVGFLLSFIVKNKVGIINHLIGFIVGFLLFFSFFSYEFFGYTNYFNSTIEMFKMVWNQSFSLDINPYKNSLLFGSIWAVYWHIIYLEIKRVIGELNESRYNKR